MCRLCWELALAVSAGFTDTAWKLQTVKIIGVWVGGGGKDRP